MLKKVLIVAVLVFSFALQAAECRGVENPVAIDLERSPVVAAVARTRAPLRVEFPVEAVGHCAQSRQPVLDPQTFPEELPCDLRLALLRNRWIREP